MQNNIQTIIDKLEELKILKLLNDKDPVYGEENQLAKIELKQFLKDSLTSMLDGIIKNIPEEKSNLVDGKYEVDDGTMRINGGYNMCRQEVINIINSHR